VYFQNVRGLRTKLFDLRIAMASVSEDFDIIVLVETWLNDGILNSELGLENFNIYRLDRTPTNSVYSRGGGVLIAVRKNLLSRVLKITAVNFLWRSG